MCYFHKLKGAKGVISGSTYNLQSPHCFYNLPERGVNNRFPLIDLEALPIILIVTV